MNHVRPLALRCISKSSNLTKPRFYHRNGWSPSSGSSSSSSTWMNRLGNHEYLLKESFLRSLSRSLKTSSKVINEAPTSGVCIKSVTCNHADALLSFEWKTLQSTSNYPYVWLRDNCQCEHCFHPISLSRTMLFDDLDFNVKPVMTKLSSDGSEVIIQWTDEHCSIYDAKWLKDRSMDTNQGSARKSVYRLKRQFWGAELMENLPRANFPDLMKCNKAILAWLQKLEIFGFVLISNAPAEYGHIRRLIERVGFIRRTHYGAEFAVKAKPDPSNVAYSNGPLQLHTDLPYYSYKPGAQLIHCIVQHDGIGGESLLADAAHVAHELKKIEPDKFDILANTFVDWTDIGQDEGREFFKSLQLPVLCLDSNGDIIRINFSHPQRDSFFNVSAERAIKWYAAMKTFHNMLHNSKFCIKFKMRPGTIQSFDNLRIVHGRTGYSFGDAKREIEGCYIDWDEIRSKRRVLENALDISSEI